MILDSPLARRITQAYQDLNEYWNAEARQRLSEGRSPLAFSQLICVDSHDDHQKVVNYLRSTRRPAIVIAGNGMCSGGRIVNYLKAMLGDSRHEVLFVGYQAKGTPGRVIQASEGAQGFVQIDLDGELHEIRAKAITLEGYSAHADQEALLNFAAGELAVTKEIILVHGEPGPKKVLAKTGVALCRKAKNGCCQNSGMNRCSLDCQKVALFEAVRTQPAEALESGCTGGARARMAEVECLACAYNAI